jgi:hypothetical protein
MRTSGRGFCLRGFLGGIAAHVASGQWFGMSNLRY